MSCEDEYYPAIQLYAILMILVIPVAVPTTFALLLFRHRHTLRDLQVLEHDAKAKRKQALWSARMLTNELEREQARAAAEATYQEACYQIQDGKWRLPGTVQLLIRGYEMRCYGFEVFECFRKAVVVVLPPLLFVPGSIEQRTFGMLISFFTFGVFAAYAPFEDFDDNILALLCQAVIFVLFLSAAISEGTRDIGILAFLDGAQTVLLAMVVACLILTEFFKSTPGSERKPTAP